MDGEQVAAIVDRSCTSKDPHPEKVAHSIADRARKRGQQVTAYRCPFSDDHHWHVGHVPSMESVQTLADAIRWRAQN